MSVWTRRLALGAAVAAVAVSAVPASGHGGPLTGKWSGYISGTGFKRHHIVITVNASETRGTWRTSSTCYGPERLESISNGYHHFRRRLGRGAHCGLAGNIDCLERAGASVYDAVTMKSSGAWGVAGTLHRVRIRHT
jgi:hypothetical protein